MNRIIPFLLGCIFTLFISAQGSLVQIFEPKTPKVTEVKVIRGLVLTHNDVKDYIDGKTKQGFIVKSIIFNSDWSKCMVVLEKY